MVLLICKWAELLARCLNAGASYQCWIDVCNFWMNVNGLSPNPQHVIGDAQVSYDHEFPHDVPHACEVCMFGISSPIPLAMPVKFSSKFFFSRGGMKMCIPSSRSTRADRSEEGTSRVSTCSVMTTMHILFETNNPLPSKCLF